MSRPVFADPKTDFVFQRIFGSEAHIVEVAVDELDPAHHERERQLIGLQVRERALVLVDDAADRRSD